MIMLRITDVCRSILGNSTKDGALKMARASVAA